MGNWKRILFLCNKITFFFLLFQKVLIYTNHTAKHHTVQPLQLPTKMFNKKNHTFSSAEMKHTSMQFLNTNALMFFL